MLLPAPDSSWLTLALRLLGLPFLSKVGQRTYCLSTDDVSSVTCAEAGVARAMSAN